MLSNETRTEMRLNSPEVFYMRISVNWMAIESVGDVHFLTGTRRIYLAGRASAREIFQLS